VNFIEQRLLKGLTTHMAKIKSREGFILVHLSHEYTSDSTEHNGKHEESALSPQEVAAKIWDQWKHCRLLSMQLNAYFKINDPE
jgi:hypothetical protein